MYPRRVPSLFIVLIAVALCLAACGGKTAEEAGAPGTSGPGAPSGPRVDPATAGVIAGRATFQGTPPKNAAINMNSDQLCATAAKGTPTEETVLVGPDGGLQNVFVYIKAGLGTYVFDAPAQPGKLAQQGCRYVPHVFGLRVGQPLQIVNDDPTLHNVHIAAKINQERNIGQPLQGQSNTVTFKAPEVMVTFRCDVHNWMNAYAGVVAHPYFAVTGSDGRFQLSDVPPGTYVVEAWQEKYGAQSSDVTIGPKETREVTFTFKS
jgi:plastocyanin